MRYNITINLNLYTWTITQYFYFYYMLVLMIFYVVYQYKMYSTFHKISYLFHLNFNFSTNSTGTLRIKETPDHIKGTTLIIISLDLTINATFHWLLTSRPRHIHNDFYYFLISRWPSAHGRIVFKIKNQCQTISWSLILASVDKILLMVSVFWIWTIQFKSRIH